MVKRRGDKIGDSVWRVTEKVEEVFRQGAYLVASWDSGPAGSPHLSWRLGYGKEEGWGIRKIVGRVSKRVEEVLCGQPT